MKQGFTFLMLLLFTLSAISQTVGNKVSFTTADGKNLTGTILEIQTGYKVKVDGVGADQFLIKNQFTVIENKIEEQVNTAGGYLQDLKKLEANVAERFKIWDWNSDGIIKNEEYKGWGTPAQDADLNKDGALTAIEYVSYHTNKSNGTTNSGPTPTRPEEQVGNAGAYLQELKKLEPNVAERFKIWDWNTDGVIKNEEYRGWGTPAQDADFNKDGALTAAEYVSYHSAKNGNAKAPAEPPLGKYNCTGYGLNASGGQGGSYVYKGHFFLQSGKRYSANNTSGTVSILEVDRKTAIQFKGGAYANIMGEYKPDGNLPRFILTWPAATTGGASSTQYCSLVK